MQIKKQSIFSLPKNLPTSEEEEVFEEILSNEQFLLERIVSTGQQSPKDFWYEQKRPEWVILLQGEATLELQEAEQTVHLKAGDYLLLPELCKHRVNYTSSEPPCVWLAFHYAKENIRWESF